MTNKQHAFRIGVFAVTTAVLVAIVLVIFGGLSFWNRRDRYYIDFSDSVMGLSSGVPVSFNGVQVGTVASIQVLPDDPSRVRVAIDVDRSTPVRTDTTAVLALSGITGLKVIDLMGRTSTAPRLPPGSSIAAGQNTLDKLTKQATTIGDQAVAILNKTDKLLAEADEVFAGVRSTIDAKEIDAIVHATRQAAESLARATHDAEALIAENRGALRTTFGALSHSSEGVSELVGELRGVVRANGGTLESAIADLRQAARSFKEFAREVRDKPSRLLLSRAAEDRKL